MLEEIFSSSMWRYNFLGNTAKDYAVALGALLALLLVFNVFQRLILAKLRKVAEKTKTDIDDALIKIFQSIRPPFYVLLALWLVLRFLSLADFVQKIIDAVFVIYVVYQVIISVQILIDYVVSKKIKEEKESKSVVGLLSKISKGVLWTLGILLILSNLGVNVTSLIAGLGIGGVAVALALQSILGDLFSSFAIHFDRPFSVGDFIIVGKDMGTVEKIGIKTTRLTSLQGQEIVISNAELTSSRINNYKKMRKRRVVFSFGVTYDTPLEKLRKIPQMIKDIIDPMELADFDRTHFHSFGDSALLFEAVYYVETGDYNQYMDINQEIHFKIKEIFEREHISMAFPTQTIYLEK